MALPLNLLPAELRPSGARWLWIPSAALGAAVLLLGDWRWLYSRATTPRAIWRR